MVFLTVAILASQAEYVTFRFGGSNKDLSEIMKEYNTIRVTCVEIYGFFLLQAKKEKLLFVRGYWDPDRVPRDALDLLSTKQNYFV